jgi:hypothetical protein
MVIELPTDKAAPLQAFTGFWILAPISFPRKTAEGLIFEIKTGKCLGVQS